MSVRAALRKPVRPHDVERPYPTRAADTRHRRPCSTAAAAAAMSEGNYGPNWNNANRIMPDSGKRKVNISMYGSMRFDDVHSADDKAQAFASAVVEHRDKLRNWKSIRHARSGIVNDLEFDAFEKWVGETYGLKGRPPTEEEALEFGRSMQVVDYNPPIDPREPRFDRVRDSLGKAMPF